MWKGQSKSLSNRIRLWTSTKSWIALKSIAINSMQNANKNMKKVVGS